jgi:hypothetical protein
MLQVANCPSTISAFLALPFAIKADALKTPKNGHYDEYFKKETPGASLFCHNVCSNRK